MPRSLSDRLAGLQKSTRPETGHTVAAEPEFSELKVPNPGLARLGFTPYEEGGYWLRVLRYDLLTRHGSRRFVDVAQANLERLAKAAKLSALPDHLVFYDTETTGLGTGAGTFPFLHAVGQIEEDEFALYQYFLMDYSAEGTMLATLLHRHLDKPGTVVISFNGKSFDWPLFRNRLVMHRQKLTAEPLQLDLLHPSRRLWRKSLERVSLAEVELHVLGLARTNDLPGKEAPARYFAYLDGLNVELLEPVFEHNATDVCSLVTLAATIAETLNGHAPVERASEYVALGRWFDEWQEHEQAQRCLVTAAKCEDADWTAFWLYSLHQKRFGFWTEAVQTWQAMSLRYPWSLSPLVELAKYAEHREHDFYAAEQWVVQALARLPVPGQSTELLKQEVEVVRALRHRLERIRRKQCRSGP